jgi:hypothetical protein
MPDHPPSPVPRDVDFELRPGGYEIRFSGRIADGHPDLVDQCADWLDDEVGAVNLGQIDHEVLLADGILSELLRQDIVGWWRARVEDLDLG